MGADGWAKFGPKHSCDWRGPRFGQALSQFAQVVFRADPNASGGLTWDAGGEEAGDGAVRLIYNG